MTVVFELSPAIVNTVAADTLEVKIDVAGEVQTARAEAQAAASIAQAAAQDAGAKAFGTYAQALAGAASLPDLAVVRVLVDETLGGRQAYYLVSQPTVVALDFDFVNGAYQQGAVTLTLVFVRTIAFNAVTVPVSSTAAALSGDVAFDSNFLYIAVAANTWRRVALGTF